MLSLVCVYNNQNTLEERLKAGLARQTVPYQLICVDNRDGRFAGAAAALNHAAALATGAWIIFLHQDVELLCDDWLDRVEASLTHLDPKGWHGVVGRTSTGRWRGLLRDRDMVFGDAFDQPVEVQTLDEIVLIHRQCGAGHRYFDEGVPGWHAYGVEACCRAIRAGARNFVLPLPVWHDSASTNLAGLGEAHAYVWAKHGAALRRIYTTCGVLPNPYGWSGSYRVSAGLRRLRDLRHFRWIRQAVGEVFQRSCREVLEEMTVMEPVIHCFHRRAHIGTLEGFGFTARARARRRIVHHFTGVPGPEVKADCVVIAPDLVPAFCSLPHLPSSVRRFLIGVNLSDPVTSPRYWRDVLGREFSCRLAVEADETRWAILDIALQPDC